jgi:hypothetical protein
MPDFYLFAGVNGAGKSTLYSNELLEDNKLSQSYRINADEIARAHNWDWRKPGTDIKEKAMKFLASFVVFFVLLKFFFKKCVSLDPNLHNLQPCVYLSSKARLGSSKSSKRRALATIRNTPTSI